MAMVATQSPLNVVRGPAKKPGWAQLVRLGGDRVAILFGELRKDVGRIDGVVERLHYSAKEERWMVQYRVEDAQLFTVRILPGLLEADVPMSAAEAGALASTGKLSGVIQEALGVCAGGDGANSVRLALKDRRAVRSFANFLRVRIRLLRNVRRGRSQAAQKQ